MNDLAAIELAYDAARRAHRAEDSSVRREDVQRARSAYEPALRQHLVANPDDHARHFRLGCVLFDTERIDEAINELQKGKQQVERDRLVAAQA